MKRILAIVVLVFAASPLALSQATGGQSGQVTAATEQQGGGAAEQGVLKVIKEYSEALLRPDTAALDRIFADEYTFTGSTGEVTNKAREIERFKSGELKFDSGRDDDVRTRVYGDTAVVTGLWTAKGMEKGKAFSAKDRWTTVLVKRDGRWQIVAEQATPVAAQPQGQQQPTPRPAEKKP